MVTGMPTVTRLPATGDHTTEDGWSGDDPTAAPGTSASGNAQTTAKSSWNGRARAHARSFRGANGNTVI